LRVEHDTSPQLHLQTKRPVATVRSTPRSADLGSMPAGLTVLPASTGGYASDKRS